MAGSMKVILSFVVILCSCFDPAVFTAEGNCFGFGFELIIARMEYLEQQSEMQRQEIVKLNQQISQSLEEKLSVQGANFERQLKSVEESILARIDSMMMGVKDQLEENQNRLEMRLDDKFTKQIAQLNEENKFEKTIEKAIQKVVDQQLNKLMNKIVNRLEATKVSPLMRSCSDDRIKSSGVYRMQPFTGEDTIEAYCEHEKLDGGWHVIQHRFDGSVNFYRGWEEYRTGFGDLRGEFIVGLETVHRLTKASKYVLAVEVESFDGKYGWAIFDRFVLGSEEEKFKLKELGNYSGTAGHSLSKSEGMEFTTMDHDHDAWPLGNCASKLKGAWWYRACAASNLNGPYEKGETLHSNFWYLLSNKTEGLKMSRMMIREA